MRLVLDTNVIVAAMRSSTGASRALLRLARRSEVVLLANVAVALEYEAVCSRPEHVAAAGYSQEDLDVFINAVVAMVEPVESHFLWRPQLRDPADECVLEAAVNGRAEAIVTFNRRDFGGAPADFGVDVWSPRDTIRRIVR